MLTNSRTLCIVASIVLIFSVMLPANCASLQHNVSILLTVFI